jgi:hypothetical protein
LPAQPAFRNTPAPAVATSALALEGWIRTYEARWTTRLISLLHQVQRKENLDDEANCAAHPDCD